MRLMKRCGILSVCLLMVLSTTVFATEMIHCPKCGTKFEANGTYVGRLAGALGGAGIGGYIGAGIGIVAGPIGGISGLIPGAIIGGLSGLLGGGHYDNNTCPKCGNRFGKMIAKPPAQVCPDVTDPSDNGGATDGTGYGARRQSFFQKGSDTNETANTVGPRHSSPCHCHRSGCPDQGQEESAGCQGIRYVNRGNPSGVSL